MKVKIQTDPENNPSLLGELTGIVQVSSGLDHVCALTTQREVLCWGEGYNGQLGDGRKKDASYGLKVRRYDKGYTILSNVVQLTSGGRHNCALTSEGKVECWGKGSEGQVGNGRNRDARRAEKVLSLEDVVQISSSSANGEHTCALTKGGGV